MTNIGPLYPSVNTSKVVKKNYRDVAVTGTEVSKDNTSTVKQKVKKQRGKDRRQRNLKPLIDLRLGRDRRQNVSKPSIDIEV